MCWGRHFHAHFRVRSFYKQMQPAASNCARGGKDFVVCIVLPPDLRSVFLSTCLWKLSKVHWAGNKFIIFKAMFRKSCAEQGENTSADSTCHSTASGKRNAGLAGIMLIAPLTAKKIYMQPAWKEFIHKSWDLLWLKESIVLSAFYIGELEGGILADVHRGTQKLWK